MARTGTLLRWQPFAELDDLRARFDKMFADFGDGCHDGVLEVTIPLTEEPKHETRTITPKAA